MPDPETTTVSPYFQPDTEREQCKHNPCTDAPNGTVMNEDNEADGRYCAKHGHLLVSKLRNDRAAAAKAAEVTNDDEPGR